MRKKTKQPGFTLLEIIIVIFIIALIATLAVTNFAPIRKNSQLKIASDSIISIFEETRNGARFGKGNIDGNPVCWGIVLNKNSTNSIQQFTTKYLKPTDNCDISSPSTPTFINKKIIEYPTIQILDLTNNQKQKHNTLIFLFKPPKGNLEIFSEFKNTAQEIKTISQVNLSLGFESDAQNPELWKELKINTLSGQVSQNENN